jgi:acetylornithine deacetylase/succinyl-diaminopimelate desuccinylase-like protein
VAGKFHAPFSMQEPKELLLTNSYSIPVTITFEQATGKNVLLLPMGSSTDAAHSINEKLDKRNYIEGTKLLGAYLHYVAEEPMENGA